MFIDFFFRCCLFVISFDSILDGPSIPTNTVFVEASPSTKSIDDSVDLDLSFTSVAKSIKTTSTKEIEPEEYVPAKGQKGAARRLNKLKSKRHRHCDSD